MGKHGHRNWAVALLAISAAAAIVLLIAVGPPAVLSRRHRLWQIVAVDERTYELDAIGDELCRRNCATDSRLLADAIQAFRELPKRQKESKGRVDLVILRLRPSDGGKQLCTWLQSESSPEHRAEVLWFVRNAPYPEVADCVAPLLDDERGWPNVPGDKVQYLAYTVLMGHLKRLELPVPPGMPEAIGGDDPGQSATAILWMKLFLADNRVEIRRKAEAWYSNEVKRIEEQTKALRQ